MSSVILEKAIELLGVEIYPVTIAKFLLNARRIKSYFAKAASKNFVFRGPDLPLDWKDCKLCKEKESLGVLCRFHTSIDRIMKTKTVGLDFSSGAYFYKNEIFKQVDDKVVIVYCPHTKLIVRPITDSKVRKIKVVTVKDLKLPEYQDVKKFTTDQFLDTSVTFWFDDEFKLVTIPVDRNYSNFYLIPNK